MPKAKEADLLEAESVDSLPGERKQRPRISIILDEDGKRADLGRIKPEMQEKIKNFLADRENLAQFGLGQEEQSAIVQFGDDTVKLALFALAKVEAVLAYLPIPINKFANLPVQGIPLDIGLKAFSFSEQQQAMLQPAVKSVLTRLAKKYPGLFIAAQNQDVITIIMVVVVQFSACWAQASKEAQSREELKQEPPARVQ
jgi:hypothetical protein